MLPKVTAVLDKIRTKTINYSVESEQNKIFLNEEM